MILHKTSDCEIYVNAEHIISALAHRNGQTSIQLTGGDQFYVKESLDDIDKRVRAERRKSDGS